MKNKRMIKRLLIIITLFILLSGHMDKNIFYASEPETESTSSDDSEELQQETTAVTDIEIGDYEEEIEVGGTTTISATVLPSDAADSSVTYTSNNPSIATVSSTGEVKGIAKGTAEITVQAGSVIKKAAIKVKVATKEIAVNATYLVLKPNEEYQLSAKVMPGDADQDVTFQSTDNSIASVSDKGKVKAKAEGSTTIMISNGDMTAAVTVIVNKTISSNDSDRTDENTAEPAAAVLGEKEQELINLLKESSVVKIQSYDYGVLTKNVLKELQEKEGKLIVYGGGYSFCIEGKDIINYENELSTQIDFTKRENGYTFVLNDGKSLPGKIKLEVDEEIDGRYLYLYNQTKEKYQLLDIDGKMLDQAGRYYIADQKLSGLKINIVIIVIVCAVLLGLAVSYVVVKKKYWFW